MIDQLITRLNDFHIITKVSLCIYLLGMPILMRVDDNFKYNKGIEITHILCFIMVLTMPFSYAFFFLMGIALIAYYSPITVVTIPKQ
jgi:hypothetical protein